MRDQLTHPRPTGHVLPSAYAEEAVFPYTFGVNGGRARPLEGWAHVADLLRLLGLVESMSFLVLDRVDGVPRWAQVLGHPDRLVVEVAGVGEGDGPWRVSRAEAGSPRSDVVSAQGFRVRARADELWDAGAGAAAVRSWLSSGTLPPELDAVLVAPLDFP